jgi:hypothetical protein
MGDEKLSPSPQDTGEQIMSTRLPEDALRGMRLLEEKAIGK